MQRYIHPSIAVLSAHRVDVWGSLTSRNLPVSSMERICESIATSQVSWMSQVGDQVVLACDGLGDLNGVPGVAYIPTEQALASNRTFIDKNLMFKYMPLGQYLDSLESKAKQKGYTVVRVTGHELDVLFEPAYLQTRTDVIQQEAPLIINNQIVNSVGS